MYQDEKRMLFIINPVAGKQEVKREIANVLEIFTSAGFLVTTHVTQRRGDATETAKLCGGEYDIIACSGGDGTFNETATGVISGGHYVPIGYMPSGSYNDFATYQQISKSMTKAARNIVKGNRRFVDVIRFETNGRRRNIFNPADFGSFTWLAYTTPQESKNTLGAYAYILEGIRDLNKIKGQHLRIEANGGTYEGTYIFGIICNATMLAGVLSKKGRLIQSDDGIMEVGLVHMPANRRDLQETIEALRREDLSDPHITFFKTREMKMIPENSLDMSLDGEKETVQDSAELECLHSRIELVG